MGCRNKEKANPRLHKNVPENNQSYLSFFSGRRPVPPVKPVIPTGKNAVLPAVVLNCNDLFSSGFPNECCIARYNLSCNLSGNSFGDKCENRCKTSPPYGISLRQYGPYANESVTATRASKKNRFTEHSNGSASVLKVFLNVFCKQTT